MATSSPHTEDLKKTLLDFTSSELSSHSASLIGLALLFFTFIELFSRQDFLPRGGFPTALPPLSGDTLRYFAFFGFSVLLSTGILYLLLRLVYYGAFAHEIITLKGFSCMSIAELRDKILEDSKNKTFWKWFSGGISPKSKGFLLCTVLGFIFSVLMMLALFLK